ncbi:hypothetical protein JCM33374_g2260 [Metschnikowia sp. JCM 33374]|nr:hypothetical protein JCM33374_g2260 [Metschnikowia sp. JCM 33374]
MASDNSYIPKFIQDVPWYYKTQANASNEPHDSLAHHRKHPGQKKLDHSQPQAGSGISDEVLEVNGTRTRAAQDYDAKRDRWHGHSAEEWDAILSRWDEVKKAHANAPVNDDSDDTDYELEREELGLGNADLRHGQAEDPLEKSVRDRRDVPAYILAINANDGGKVRVGKDSTVGLVHAASDFVKESSEVTEFKKAQHFAWEKNQQHEANQKKRQYDAQLAGLQNPNALVEHHVQAADLDYSMEASPTLMSLKARQKEDEKKAAAAEKRRKLMEKYGS